MTENIHIISKVLVHEVNEEHTAWLKQFFEESHLVGLKAPDVLKALELNIDLGAIFLCEKPGSENNISELAIKIHNTRRELPLFLRIEDSSSEESLPLEVKKACTGIYKQHEQEKLKTWLQKYIFQSEYPSSFIKTLVELSENALRACFPGLQINCASPPYLVRDQLIFGELFSMIALEAPWCRGYLMIQAETAPLLRLIKAEKTIQPPDDLSKYNMDDLISELTNLIWGGFKGKFAREGLSGNEHRTEIPIVINHDDKYISFGSVKPQLCFHYTLNDPEGKLPEISLYEKLVFSLDWNPEAFQEPSENIQEFIDDSIIELF